MLWVICAVWQEGSVMKELEEFLRRLEQCGIFFKLDRIREGSVLVEVAVPGQRWEVEFMTDGAVEIEVFKSDGEIEGREAIERLFAEFAAPA